ncbi:Dynein heavy chain 3, axonemal [Lamellibrachia satsuma]|nr:Dynein heavy chain 3, axonemal [Lamellibrachia satsuma]
MIQLHHGLMVFQIYDMIQLRHGLMVVGNPLAGKSSALYVLASALSDLSRQQLMDEYTVEFRVINPKAVTMGQLYGCFDIISHEWSDGVLANTFREYASSTTPLRKWIIFDGPVDAIWIENMNTVLDDNKKLCLMSGEIIQMNSKMNMIFEPQDLEQASPATVSRCGMIYMEPVQLGWKPLVESWMQQQLPECLNEEQRNTIQLMFEWLLPLCLDYVTKYCRQTVTCHPMHLTMSMLKLYACLLDDVRRLGQEDDDDINMDDTVEDEEPEEAETDPLLLATQQKLAEKLVEEQTKMLIAYFLFSIVWSVAATLDSPSKLKFDEFLRLQCASEGEHHAKQPRPKELKIPRGLFIPKRGLVYDHVYLQNTFGSWSTWSSMVTTCNIDQKGKVNELIIDTIDTVRQRYLLEKLVLKDKPILFVGPTGTGKSAITNNFLFQLPKEKFIVSNVNFSSRTTSNQTQDFIFSKLERKRRGVYGPSPGRQLKVFVDDLNMPAKERYGAQPPIEILRQLIDQGYWFDR